ncbi:MAG: hypothetical protein WBG90_09780 [Saonia sp.]
MSRVELENTWNATGANADSRFNTFQQWLQSDIQTSNGAQITSFLQHAIADDSRLAIFNYGGIEDAVIQVSIASDIFLQTAPDTALEVGDMIIAISISYAVEFDARKENNKANKRNKDYDKQLDKWLDQMKKDLFKDIADAYKEYRKYLQKKIDYGSP